MPNSLLKNVAHNSFADGIYNEIITRATRYYHFFGKTLTWPDDLTPPLVIDSRAYEREVRNEIIAMKEITPPDVSYVLPRINWTSGTVYDTYDDQYSSEIQGINLLDGGSAYGSAPSIVIGTPVTTATNVVLNSQYYYNGYLYTVTQSGLTGNSNSVLSNIFGVEYTHGDAKLTCVGVQATAVCSIGTSAPHNQKVISITLTNRGSGYISAPTVTFSSGTASAVAVMKLGTNNVQKLEDSIYYVFSSNNIYVCISNNNNSVSTVAPSGASSGYITTSDGYVWKFMCVVQSNSKFLTPTWVPIVTSSKNLYSATGSLVDIRIESAGTGYFSATNVLPLNTAIALNNQYYYNGYVYKVTTTGTSAASYSGIGTVIGTTYTFGSASISCLGLLTTISITGDGSGAAISPLITNGKLTGLQITDAGSGYTYCNITVIGSGYGAVVSSSIYGKLQSESLQSQIETSTISGNICSISVISGGYGYTNPVVTIVGDGSNAVATAVVSAGVITNIIISDANHGFGYTWANITITDSVGVGAKARAILSPYGGLGRDPVNQLCVNSLMLYSRVANNTNHGIEVTNDYRQVGIIKDPNRYSDSTKMVSNFATGCWKIQSSTTIPVSIVVDDILTTISNSITYRYRVISVSGSTCLVIPLDNGIPVVNTQFVKSSNIYFSALTVTQPTVDKYSGDLLFIDNESSFVASTDSPIILRTVINF